MFARYCQGLYFPSHTGKPTGVNRNTSRAATPGAPSRVLQALGPIQALGGEAAGAQGQLYGQAGRRWRRVRQAEGPGSRSDQELQGALQEGAPVCAQSAPDCARPTPPSHPLHCLCAGEKKAAAAPRRCRLAPDAASPPMPPPMPPCPDAVPDAASPPMPPRAPMRPLMPPRPRVAIAAEAPDAASPPMPPPMPPRPRCRHAPDAASPPMPPPMPPRPPLLPPMPPPMPPRPDAIPDASFPPFIKHSYFFFFCDADVIFFVWRLKPPRGPGSISLLRWAQKGHQTLVVFFSKHCDLFF